MTYYKVIIEGYESAFHEEIVEGQIESAICRPEAEVTVEKEEE
jgi:hypothetical protein